MKNDKVSAISRRVYKYNGVTLVLFKGAHYGRKETAIDVAHPAKVSLAGNGTVKLTQRVNKKAAVTEIWRKVKL